MSVNETCKVGDVGGFAGAASDLALGSRERGALTELGPRPQTPGSSAPCE